MGHEEPLKKLFKTKISRQQKNGKLPSKQIFDDNNSVYGLKRNKCLNIDVQNHIGLDARKNCLRGVANNTGADQPAHPRSLISAFVIRFWESIISRLATSEISNF